MGIFGNIEINRKPFIETYNESNNINQQPIQPTQQPIQNQFENLMVNDFQSNVEIIKNGQKVGRFDYYNDFKERTNSNININQNEYYPVSNEQVDQVDPESFFGNSLGSIINKIKNI